MWGDVKIVHGKPRHSQSQGSVERANRDVEDMLATWMAENKSSDWPSGLKFIQFRKNRAFHSGIGRSPYEAMFGCSARLGVASIVLPMDEIDCLQSEEAQNDHLGSDSLDSEQCHTTQVEENGPGTGNNSELINQRQQKIQHERALYVKCLEKQAKKMVKTSNSKYPELEVGTSVWDRT
ncbi:KRAB-A domain-containing protein 2-like [Metopolophium dirhodum]|uniref:KRAB-A domain-containing protein 2-like n=1 Tax=Metopolophium dirhodum TaxID=44670 RepID=UPI0029906CF0|nr:KRAB-A domain-containing protein 2-like [Metopolophium dirhodum]